MAIAVKPTNPGCVVKVDSPIRGHDYQVHVGIFPSRFRRLRDPTSAAPGSPVLRESAAHWVNCSMNRYLVAMRGHCAGLPQTASPVENLHRACWS